MLHTPAQRAMSPALREAYAHEADCLRRLNLARKQFTAAKEKRRAIEAGEGAR